MENITLQNLGNILKQRRKEKGYTQKQVAEGIQVDQSIVSDWERGAASPVFINIYKLCQFFDMSLDELLGVEKKKYLNLIVSRDDINKLHTTLQEFEEALNFIFPNPDTKLHHKWAEIKRLFELLLLNTE